MQDTDAQSWGPLVDELSPVSAAKASSNCQELPRLPITHFHVPLPPDPTPDELHKLYLSLYGAATKAVADFSGARRNNVEPGSQITEGSTTISYNLAMTTSTMMICPRRNECAMFPLKPETRTDAADAGLVSINGTILAGTLMVKAEAEWNELQNSSTRLKDILKTVGIPTQID